MDKNWDLISFINNISITKQANLQQTKEIKDAIQVLNEQMVEIDAKIMSNHQEVMNKIEIVDKKQRKPYKLQRKTKPKLLK